MIAFASSLDQAGPLTRDVTDAALLLGHMVGRDACDATSLQFPERDRAAERRAPGRRAPRRARRAAAGEGDRAGRAARRSSATLELAQRARARASRRCALPHAPHALSAYYVLAPAEASLEPRALRRRPLRLRARRARRTCWRCTRAPATTASAPRSSGASCSAPTRCRAATTTPTTAARSACARRSPRTSRRRSRDVDLIVTPTVAERRVRARREDGATRSRCTSTTSAPCRCRWPASRRSRSRAGSRRRRADGRPAGRPADRRPGVQREPAARRRLRARAGDRLRRERGACLSAERAGGARP